MNKVYLYIVTLLVLFIFSDIREVSAQNLQNNHNNNKVKQQTVLSREELFKKVFKTAPPKFSGSTFISLWLNQTNKGKIQIRFKDDRTDIFLPGVKILEILTDILNKETIEILQGKLDKKQQITKKGIEESGILVKFYPSKFQIQLTVPDHLKGTQIHHLAGKRINPYSTKTIPPDQFSGFVNFSAKQGFSYNQLTSSSFQQHDLSVNFDGALNFKGLVLEGSLSLKKAKTTSLLRNDVRLVFDRHKKALRYTIGDLFFPIVGYQSVLTIGGIGLSKDFKLLQPSQNAFPVRDFEFFIKNTSQVEIWINGSLTNTITLNSGTHDIRDFPLSSGENDIEIIITDASGKKQKLNYSLFHDRALLATGKDQYSFNLGFQRWSENMHYFYDTNDPILSLFYQGGISPRFTLGAYSQIRKQHILFGTEGLFASPIGKFQFNIATSNIDSIGTGFACKLIYTHFSQKKRHLSYRSQAEYLGLNFGGLKLTSPQNTISLKISNALSMPLLKNISVGIGANYMLTRKNSPSHIYQISTSIKKRWFKKINTSFTVEHSKTISGNISTKIHAGFSWLITYKKQSFYLSKSQHSGLAINWHNNNYSSSPGKTKISIQTNTESTKSTLQGKLKYQGNQGNIELSQLSVIPYPKHENDPLKTHHQSYITIQSALVFAGKSIALSRPINNGFLLVKGIKNLKKKKIAINGRSNGFQALSRTYRPAVLNRLPAYQIKKLNIEPINPPIGYFPNKINYTLFPTYKCGYSVYLGSEETIVMLGTISDKNGKPLANQAFNVYTLNKEDAEPLFSFTNSKGRFQISELTTGEHQLKSADPQGWQILIKITDNTKGIYRIGNLTAQ